MAVYFDTSLLVSLFVLEPISPRVALFAASVGQPIVFSDFQRAELVTALHCKEGRNDITAADVAGAVKDVQSELLQGTLEWREPDWKHVFGLTARLSAAHGARTLCRTLDSIHVALALTLGCTEFATLDHRQEALAIAAGLKVLKP